MQSLPLVLVPGLMCNERVWNPVIQMLDVGQPPVVVDHGGADSLQAMAQQILDAVPGPLLLAGHSMGGRVAFEVIRMAPKRVKGVALMDTGHLPREAGDAGALEESKRMALLQIASEQGVRAMASQWVTGMVHPDRLTDAALIEQIVAMFALKSADIFACQIKALLARPDGSDVLRSLAVPALLQCGRQDSWSPPSQHRAMQMLATSAVLDVIEGAGHMAPMERPQAVAESLNRWLQTCRVAEAVA